MSNGLGVWVAVREDVGNNDSIDVAEGLEVVVSAGENVPLGISDKLAEELCESLDVSEELAEELWELLDVSYELAEVLWDSLGVSEELAEELWELLDVSEELGVSVGDGEAEVVTLGEGLAEGGHTPVELSHVPPEKLVGSAKQMNVWLIRETAGRRGGGSGKGPQREL